MGNDGFLNDDLKKEPDRGGAGSKVETLDRLKITYY